MTIQILDTIGDEWETGHPKASGSGTTPGFTRKRWLQGLSDVVSRHINNRVSANTNATAVVCNGAVQSTGLGSAAITPGKYGETQVQARVTLNAPAGGVFYVYVYRTTGAIPANGAAPGGGDVVVGGDAFGGGTLAAGVNTPETLSVFDQNLLQTQAYKYYFAVQGPAAATLNLINGSQLTVSEF